MTTTARGRINSRWSDGRVGSCYDGSSIDGGFERGAGLAGCGRQVKLRRTTLWRTRLLSNPMMLRSVMPFTLLDPFKCVVLGARSSSARIAELNFRHATMPVAAGSAPPIHG